PSTTPMPSIMKSRRWSRSDAASFSSTTRSCFAIRKRLRPGGVEALERCFARLEDRATFVVHVCRGYPNKPLERKGVRYKANQDYYRDILSWLSESRLDVVSIEGAASNLDLSTLSGIGEKSVMLGVIDVGENGVESVEPLVARAGQALSFVPKGHLILAPDCRMLELWRARARAELM